MKGKEERKERLKWLIKRVLLVIPVACLLLWIYAVCQTSSIKDQTKMSSIKVFIRKLVELPMREVLLYLFEIRNWMKKGRASRSMIFAPKK